MTISIVTVFLVEDDALTRDLLDTALTEAGFEVVAVADGARALAELDADATRFRAVITDINLGAGPDGWAIARRARELVATMPIVYMSGDSGHDWSSQGVPKSVMIIKPFAPAQIVTAVSALLNEVDAQ